MKTIALGSLVLLAGCDPRAFDDLADQTWVDTSGTPEDLNSEGYGAALGFGGSGGQGVRIVAASRTPAGVARLVYAGDGTLETQSELVADTQQVNQLAEHPAIAGDPSSYGMATGTVALGATDGTTAFALMIDVESANLQLTPLNLTIPGEPSGLAFGDSQAAGAGTGPDLVAVAGTSLAIKPDYQTTSTVSTCTLAAAPTSVHIADLGGDSVGEIVVGFADGTLQAFTGSALIAASGVACIDGGAPAFDFDVPASGAVAAVASGDFDGNGETDLAIGLPGEGRIAILMNTQDGANEISIEAPAGASGFGALIAVGDFDGDLKDDLAVGDPEASAGGKSGAGSVYLFRGGATLARGATLFDASPESDQHFGRALTRAAFDDERDLLIVSAADEIFTYFRNPLGGDDVRR